LINEGAVFWTVAGADAAIALALIGLPGAAVFLGLAAAKATRRDWFGWLVGFVAILLSLAALQSAVDCAPDIHARLKLYAVPGR
jgi:hypothetical protein